MSTKLWVVRAALTTEVTDAVDADVLAALAAVYDDGRDVSFAAYDGPLSSTTLPETFILVGTDGGETGHGNDAVDGCVVAQELSPMGNNWRDERGEITCAAWAHGGSTDIVPLRQLVTILVDVVEVRLQTDRSLGGAIDPRLGRAEFAGMRVRELQTPKGAVVRAVFTVSYTATLTI
jgi:hypothetical protein